MNKFWLAALLVATGCAAPHPKVDISTVDAIQYQQDLIECTVVAETGREGAELSRGGLYGAGMGAATQAASLALSGGDWRAGVVLGIIGGFVGGMMAEDHEADAKTKKRTANCLEGRGYTVLNKDQVG